MVETSLEALALCGALLFSPILVSFHPFERDKREEHATRRNVFDRRYIG